MSTETAQSSATAKGQYDHRILNFSAGPAVLPESVLKQLQEDIWNFAGSGVGVLEHSHRGKEVDRIYVETDAAIRELANVGDDHEVLFLSGGASQHFAKIPMNFIPTGGTADYLSTGLWATLATEEAARIAEINVAYDGKADMYYHVPADEEIKRSEKASYLHYCSNNTIYGTQFQAPPASDAPLVVDMGSEMFSRPWNYGDHGIVYACAQKNIGPAGVVLLIMRKDFLERANTGLPNVFSYPKHAAKGSRYNTPPVMPIHAMGLVCQWILDEGGLDVMAKRNEAKAKILYDAIDTSAGFYTCHSDTHCRSMMNVSFKAPNAELDAKFLAEATANEMSALKGHRSVGGMRASIYNAFPAEGCERLAQLMQEFARTNG